MKVVMYNQRNIGSRNLHFAYAWSLKPEKNLNNWTLPSFIEGLLGLINYISVLSKKQNLP